MRPEIEQAAKDAGCVPRRHPEYWDDVQVFATPDALVKFYDSAFKAGAEQERKASEERYMQLFLDPENQPTQFGTATQEYREREVQEEREACETACDRAYHQYIGPQYGEVRYGIAACKAAISARGSK